MIGQLPTVLEVEGREYNIRTDYRNVLEVFVMFNDSELTITEKWIVAIYMIFSDFNDADDVEDAMREGFPIREAVKQLQWFFSMGQQREEKQKKPIFDWEQDEQMLFASVNKVANKEVRELEYLHWWTFLSYFHEIGEGQLSYIVGIRKKKNENEKLSKHEQKFYRENKDIVDLQRRYTKEEREFMDYVGEFL